VSCGKLLAGAYGAVRTRAAEWDAVEEMQSVGQLP
jgi:hypothetical protein